MRHGRLVFLDDATCDPHQVWAACDCGDVTIVSRSLVERMESRGEVPCCVVCRGGNDRQDDRQTPTLEEIRERCAIERMGWDEETELKRRGGSRRWDVPEVDSPEMEET